LRAYQSGPRRTETEFFIDGQNAKDFQNIYTRFTRSRVDYQDLVYEKKKLIMETAMSGEVNTLSDYLDRISETDRHSKRFYPQQSEDGDHGDHRLFRLVCLGTGHGNR
jgi:maltooligosyltrehalose synthase